MKFIKQHFIKQNSSFMPTTSIFSAENSQKNAVPSGEKQKNASQKLLSSARRGIESAKDIVRSTETLLSAPLPQHVTEAEKVVLFESMNMLKKSASSLWKLLEDTGAGNREKIKTIEDTAKEKVHQEYAQLIAALQEKNQTAISPLLKELETTETELKRMKTEYEEKRNALLAKKKEILQKKKEITAEETQKKRAAKSARSKALRETVRRISPVLDPSALTHVEEMLEEVKKDIIRLHAALRVAFPMEKPSAISEPNTVAIPNPPPVETAPPSSSLSQS